MCQRRPTGRALGWAVVVAFAAALGFTMLGSATAAPVIVAGTYTITVTGGDGAIGLRALKIAPGCSNGSDDDLDTKVDHPADPECATATDSNEGPDNTEYVPPTFVVDIDATGNVSAKASNVKWQDIWQRQDTGVPLGVKDLLVRFVPDDVGGKSVSGSLDAATGALSLTWRFHIETSIVGVPGTLQIGTPTVPLEAKLSTGTAGGAAFDPATLTATLVDDQIVYPGAQCVGNPLLCPTMVTTANGQLGLPTTAGQSTLKVSGAVDRSPIADDGPPPDEADLALTKVHVGDFTLGVDGTYSLTVSNVGAAASAGNVTVVDTLPAELVYKAFTGTGWGCTADGQVVTCTSSAPIAAGADAEALSLTVTPSAAGAVVNEASVSNAGDTNPANDAASDPTTVVGEPPPDEADLTLAKAHTGDFTLGVDGTYSLTVSNVGAAASAGDVTVVDTLPAELAYKAFTGTGWGCTADGQVVTCTSSAPIGAGADAEVLSLTVTPSAAGSVVNEASVSGGGQSNTLNDGASDPTTVVGEPPPDEADLTLAKAHTGDFTLGVDGTYSLTVSNVGAAASAGDVTVVDTLPAELAYKAFTGTGWGCTAAGQVVTCTSSASIGAGADAEVLSLTVTPSAAGSVVNEASVSGGGQSNTLNDGASDPTTIVDAGAGGPTLALTKSHEGNFVVGADATWVLRIANVGDGTTTEPIALADPLPAEVDFVDFTLADDSGWTCDETEHVVACVHAGPLDPDDSLPPVGVVVKAAAAGTVTNNAVVTSGELTAAASDTAVVDPAQPALKVDVEAPALTVGVQATLAFTVTNDGTGPTTGPVDLSIPLPLDLTLTNATGAGWACRNAGTTTSVMNVACTTNAVAEADAALPVVNVVVTPKTAGTFPIGATVATAGSTDGTVTTDVVVAGTTTPGTDGAGQGGTASGLPFTGGELAVILEGAVAALGLGGGLVGLARTRRRKTAPGGSAA